MRPDAHRYIRSDYPPPAAAAEPAELMTSDVVASRQALADIECLLTERKLLVAMWRFTQARRRYLLGLKAGFDPNQPRDDHGRWTDGGNSSRSDGSIDHEKIIDPRTSITGQPGISLAAARGGIPRLFWHLTVRQFVSQYCKATINRELPGQFEEATIGDLIDLAKGGDAAARKCMKILNQGRFRKN